MSAENRKWRSEMTTVVVERSTNADRRPGRLGQSLKQAAFSHKLLAATARSCSQLQLRYRCTKLRQEINTFIFWWKLARCCTMLQPIAKHEAVKWAWFFSFNSRSIFKFGVMSFITSFVNVVRPGAIVENSNAWKESGLTLVFWQVIIIIIIMLFI